MKTYLLKCYYKLLDFKQIVIKGLNQVLKPFITHPVIHDTDTTIAYILKHKCSVSRFGDGEFALLHGKSIAFQDANEVLATTFKTILKHEHPNHITCLPYALINTDTYTDKARTYWNNYTNVNRLSIYKCLNRKKHYYDALFSRLYMDTQDKTLVAQRFNAVKRIWQDQDVVFIEGHKSRLGVGNDLFTNAKSTKRIICPSTNAFNAYNTILNFIIKHCNKKQLFLLALGPTATALAFDLHKKGYWAIDIGHIDIEYEWMLMKAIEKVPVKNKFVGDTFAFDEQKNALMYAYNKQILIEID